MSELNYKPVPRHSREELECAFRSNEPSLIHDAIISAAYWDEDWRWIQDRCIELAQSPSDHVRAGAAYAFGLLAVFHAQMDLQRVQPVLEALCLDPVAGPYAEESLADVEHFLVKLKGKVKAERLPPK